MAAPTPTPTLPASEMLPTNTRTSYPSSIMTNNDSYRTTLMSKMISWMAFSSPMLAFSTDLPQDMPQSYSGTKDVFVQPPYIVANMGQVTSEGFLYYDDSGTAAAAANNRNIYGWHQNRQRITWRNVSARAKIEGADVRWLWDSTQFPSAPTEGVQRQQWDSVRVAYQRVAAGFVKTINDHVYSIMASRAHIFSGTTDSKNWDYMEGQWKSLVNYLVRVNGGVQNNRRFECSMPVDCINILRTKSGLNYTQAPQDTTTMSDTNNYLQKLVFDGVNVYVDTSNARIHLSGKASQKPWVKVTDDPNFEDYMRPPIVASSPGNIITDGTGLLKSTSTSMSYKLYPEYIESPGIDNRRTNEIYTSDVSSNPTADNVTPISDVYGGTFDDNTTIFNFFTQAGTATTTLQKGDIVVGDLMRFYTPRILTMPVIDSGGAVTTKGKVEFIPAVWGARDVIVQEPVIPTDPDALPFQYQQMRVSSGIPAAVTVRAAGVQAAPLSLQICVSPGQIMGKLAKTAAYGSDIVVYNQYDPNVQYDAIIGAAGTYAITTSSTPSNPPKVDITKSIEGLTIFSGQNKNYCYVDIVPSHRKAFMWQREALLLSMKETERPEIGYRTTVVNAQNSDFGPSRGLRSTFIQKSYSNETNFEIGKFQAYIACDVFPFCAGTLLLPIDQPSPENYIQVVKNVTA